MRGRPIFILTLHVGKTGKRHRRAWKAVWQIPNVTRPELNLRGMAIFFPTLHVRKTGSSEDRAHSGESMQSNRNEEGCRLCPPEPLAAHGHVNGWREAPGWSEAEGFGGHSLSLTDIAIATGVPAKHTTGHTSAGTRSFRRLK